MTDAGNRDGIAALLDGIEYPMDRDPRWKAALESAEVWGLVIIAAASDDILGFDGAFSDEVYGVDGILAKIDAEGPLPDREDIEGDEELERFFARKKNAATIRAFWCPDDDDVSWAIRSEIPHSKFNVMEDGEVFCRAIVIDVRDLPATRSSKEA